MTGASAPETEQDAACLAIDDARVDPGGVMGPGFS